MHRWWHRCLEIAGVPPHPIREARHTPITDFLRATGNLKLAQQLARHRTIQTTADIYGHLDDIDLERALEAVASLTADDHSFRDQPFPSEDR
jgi:integrase